MTSDLSKKYLDPPNTQEIIESLKQAKTHNNVVDIIVSKFPDWVLGWPTKYCSDYPHLKQNWDHVCAKIKTKPLNVVIVDFIDFNSLNHTLVQTFCEILTLFGHSVRRKEEFISCKICGDAIPSLATFEQFKEKQIPNLPYYSLKCLNC